MRQSEDDITKTILERGAHCPVMLGETVSLLNPQDSLTYLDCTFGGGGHTRAILEKSACKVVALDRDPQAAMRAREFEKKYRGRFEFHQIKFSDLDKLQTGGYAGILFDFGVSSFQLDDPARGFSFMRDGKLDMRMNPEEGISALEYVNSATEKELADDIYKLGGEARSRGIARAIVEARSRSRIERTSDLAAVISGSVGVRTRIHPATKTFQAIRIRVNGELDEISSALPKAFSVLAKGGTLAAITFHSLEDRIVKRFFKKCAGLPEGRFDHGSVQDRIKLGTLLTRSPLTPSDREIAENPRSRSAKLRAIRKD